MTEHSRNPSRSRRSYPNLHNLSLAPLSAKYPLDASAPPSPDEQVTHTPRTSYIAPRTAPTTPGILSLSQSRSNSRTRRSKPIYAYDSYFVSTENRDVGDIPKAKSTSTLAHPHVNFAVADDGKHHTRKGTAPLPLRMPLVRHHTASVDDEWWHRAGLAIAGETRDSKGQGWLVRRESSTSLVANEDQDQNDSKRMALLSGEPLNGEEFPTFSPRISRAGSRFPSRVGSRVPSARQSRRGSRVGSKIDLGMSPVSARHSLDQDLPSFDERFMTGPDFVEDSESSGDEEEVARLAHSGGSWIDRLIGWTLFSVDEDGEASSEEEEEGEEGFLPMNMTREELRLRREVEAKRRKLERETIVAAAKLKTRDQDNVEDGGESRPSTAELEKSAEEGGGWQDAAWLLSVASKALF
jgi:hypothetical protein